MKLFNLKHKIILLCLVFIVSFLMFQKGITETIETKVVNNQKTGSQNIDSQKAESENIRMLKIKIDEMKKKRGSGYKPRTRHLLKDGSAKYTNRLFFESSPYLLQHAHNPVNWYPWGEEAFEAAKRLNRPLFVSIGYSTCHWCHVMEEESFEDEEIASYINEHYIPVKVDREERPDVDSIYMTAVQIMTGSGGWPLNVWLTPERIPFFGGTYFPPRDGDRGAPTGFLSILKQIGNVYQTKPEMIQDSGKQLTQFINQSLASPSGTRLPPESLRRSAIKEYKKRYDPKYGGANSAPKFPSTINLRLLLREWKHTNDPATLEIVVNTLNRMADGGINDQVGGGFHRYSTDSKWLVPHFEKMLYDNALLASTFLEAFQATGNERFKTETRNILDYVKKEMTDAKGGFYSATDADTLTESGEKEEGYFFTWTIDELKSALLKEDFNLVKNYYLSGTTPDFEGRYILHITEAAPVIAQEAGISITEFEKKINRIKTILYKERQKKAPPFTDTKILASWNGLMISAFAKAGLIFGDSAYQNVAEQAADFVLTHLVKDERLYRSYKDDTAKYLAYLDDYSFMVAALIDIYEMSGEVKWLEKAVVLNKSMVTLFEDEINGGFYMTSSEHENLLAREKPIYDGATPSGNSIAVLNLLRLYSFTTDIKYMEHAEKALTTFSDGLVKSPISGSEMLIALDYYYGKPKEIVIVTPENSQTSKDVTLLMDELKNVYLPNRILIVVREGRQLNEVSKIIPLVKSKIAINKKTTVYICEKGVCKLPASLPAELRTQLTAK